MRCPQASRFGDAFGGLYGPNAYNSIFSYPWNQTDPDNGLAQPCPYLTSTLQFGCTACPSGTYSLSFGRSNGTAGAALNPDCFLCPFGAVCTGAGGIIAQPGYWGSVTHSGYVNFTVCPSGYCCNDVATCTSMDSCFGNRTGLLCGECLPGFTQSVDSTACVPTSACARDMLLFWPLAVVGILLAAFLQLLLVSDLLPGVRLWFRECVQCFRRLCQPDSRKRGSRGDTADYNDGLGVSPPLAESEAALAPQSSPPRPSTLAAGDAKFKVFSYFTQVGHC